MYDLFPFKDTYGDSIGRGKDNVVVPFLSNPGLVLKWNHDPKVPTDFEAYFQKVLYKKRKYQLLKHFLGDFIPNSNFVLGNKIDGGVEKIKEYTVQNRVPQVTLSSLTENQKSDPRLISNLYSLVFKLQNMYRAINYVNSCVDDDARIDGNLDLGGLSKYAMEYCENNNEHSEILCCNNSFMTSPNLLVNPNTMDIYCIDFGQGVWNDKKEETLRYLVEITSPETQTS